MGKALMALINSFQGKPMTPEQIKFRNWLRGKVHTGTITVEQAREQWKAKYGGSS